MNLKTKILNEITKNICSYLSLDENLFFCGGHIDHRVREGRRYLCYIAKKEFAIPAVFIRHFLNYERTSTVDVHFHTVRVRLSKNPDGQIAKDIKAISKKSEDILMQAA